MKHDIISFIMTYLPIIGLWLIMRESFISLDRDIMDIQRRLDLSNESHAEERRDIKSLLRIYKRSKHDNN